MTDHLHRDEEGSILLLSLGYAVLALLLVLVCVDATSLYIAHKRTQALADAAALAGADAFTFEVDGGDATAALTDAGVRALAGELVAHQGEATLVSAGTPDGVSARVTVATVWHPPIATVLLPAGVPLEATATSRTGFG